MVSVLHHLVCFLREYIEYSLSLIDLCSWRYCIDPWLWSLCGVCAVTETTMRSKQQTNTTDQSLGIITYRQVIHVQWSTNPLIFKLLLLFSGSDLDKAGPGRLGFWRWRSCLLVGGGSGVETPFWGSSSKKTRSSKTSCENKHREKKTWE